MAYPEHRSCVKDLHAGATDGTWKKYAMNRGGIVEDSTLGIRKQMSGTWHGFNEVQPKVLPDGTKVGTPYYADVTPADSENI